MLTEVLIHNAKIWRAGVKYSKNKSKLYSWFVFNKQTGRITSCGLPGSPPPSEDVEKIDLAGKWVLPGFHDAHLHTDLHGKYLTKSKNLGVLHSIKGFQEKVKALLQMPENAPEEGNKWFLGTGWTVDTLERYPTACDLDRVASDRPLVISDISDHIIVVNSMALKIGVITKETKEITGGKIDRYPEGHEFAGHPTGILRENSAELMKALIPRSKEGAKQNIKSALNDCIEQGITSVHCLNEEEWEACKELADEDQLPIQCFLSLVYPILEHVERPKQGGEKRGLLTCRCIKIFIDGALGSETAALSQPYVRKLPNGEDNYGVLCHPQEKVNEMVKTADEQGFQLEIHVIGDRAAEIALEALETNKISPSKRPIFVHCQILNHALIKRMKACGVVASIQPQFVVTDSRWICDRLPDDLQKCMYPWKTLIDNGIICAGGSDSPVEYPYCLQGIYDAIFQPDSAREPGRKSFQPNECVTFEQAVDMYTADAAFVDFAENEIGRLEPGYFANFVVLNAPSSGEVVDLPSHPECLLDTSVAQTWARGVKIFDSNMA